MTRVARLAAVISLAVGTAACAAPDPDVPASGRYVSRSVTAPEDGALFDGTTVTATIEGADGGTRLEVHADCNGIDALVQPRDGRLVARELSITELG